MKLEAGKVYRYKGNSHYSSVLIKVIKQGAIGNSFWCLDLTGLDEGKCYYYDIEFLAPVEDLTEFEKIMYGIK